MTEQEAQAANGTATDMAPAAVGAEISRDGTLTMEQDPKGTQEQGTGLDAEALTAELAKVRKEAARYRTKAKKLEAAEGERARAAMTEAEKTAADLLAAKEQIASLEAKLSTQAIAAKVQAIAADKVEAGALDIVIALLDLDSLEETEIGPAIDAVLKEKPFLAKTQQAPGSIMPTNPAQGQSLETDAAKRARLLFGQSRVNVFGGGQPGG